jgi:hypothetical protein
MTWAGGSFDPHHVDIPTIEKRLAALTKRGTAKTRQ